MAEGEGCSPSPVEDDEKQIGVAPIRPLRWQKFGVFSEHERQAHLLDEWPKSGGTAMAELVVIGFDGPEEADRVLTELRRLQKEYLIDLEDGVVAIRQADGTVQLKQSLNLVGVGAASGGLSGAFWGALLGLVFLNPLAGFAIGGLAGAGAGALSGAAIDYGIDDNFIRSLAATLKPGSSALFVLVRKAQPEKVLSELSRFRGHVLRTSLSPEQEARLQAALSGSAPAAQTATASPT
jgi:uncharacterized membrane protein